jgi:hypothetical protein
VTIEGGREKPSDQPAKSSDDVMAENVDRETLVGRYGEAMLRIGQLESQLQELTDELRLRERQASAGYATTQFQYTQGLPYLEQKIAELQKAIDSASASGSETTEDDGKKATGRTEPEESEEMRQLRIQINSLSGQLAVTDQQLTKIQGGRTHRRHRGPSESEGGGHSRRRSRGQKSVWQRLRKAETYKTLIAKYRYVLYAAVIVVTLISAGVIYQSLTAKPVAPTSGGQTVSQGGSLISGIRVDSTVPWNSTGVIVSNSDVLEMTASGVVTYEPGRSSSPDGDTLDGVWQNGNDNASVAPWMAPSLPGQSLIAKIGTSGEPFYVGRYALVRPNEAGELFLGVNEKSSGGRGDNAGSWTVEVGVKGCCASGPERMPISLEMTASGDDGVINLSWEKLGGDVLGYNVYRALPGVLGVEIARLGLYVTEFVLPGPSQGGKVCAFIRPYDASGLRVASEQKCVDMPNS